ncbi:MFS transporter [Candidatus Thorarchaeota archaeon]|nr:MAG: MFS transporter [Candidatus Thorarchaeota archaeon]
MIYQKAQLRVYYAADRTRDAKMPSTVESPVIEAESAEKMTRLSILTSVSRLGWAFNIVVLPLFAIAIGQDEAFYGLMVAAAGYVQSAVLFPAGTFSDRAGRGKAILVGTVASGICLFALPFTSGLWSLGVYALTGIGNGFTSTSVNSLVADYTEKGEERTRSYGVTQAAATLAGTVAPFLGGYILDPVAAPFLDAIAIPGVSSTLTRFAVIFFIMGSIRMLTGVYGIQTEDWLKENYEMELPDAMEEGVELEHLEDAADNDAKTSLLFGVNSFIMGFSSGMVVPYLIPWINKAFTTEPVILGSVPAVSNLILASGTLFVGFSSERIGKLRLVFLLYLLAPILTVGLVWAPYFLLMVVFYIIRMAVANMARPATNSLFMGEITSRRRGRSWAVNRIMWTFPRQTGTILTSFILSAGIFGGIVPFGELFFPIAMALYPVSVLPMYIAVKRNERRREELLALEDNSIT